MYKFSKLIKEQSIEGGASHNIWVALITSDDCEQPFRVVVENFETEADVMNEVNAWIEARNKEDEAAALEREQLAREAMQEDVASRLNSSL